MKRQVAAGWRGPGPAGFTLIELLVVISIIGLLAALVVGLAGRAGGARRENQIRAQLSQLSTAIETFKTDLGTYPRSHVSKTDPRLAHPDLNLLYYELSGVWLDQRTGTFYPAAGGNGLTSAQAETYFNVKGFQNTATSADKVKSFAEFKEAQYADADGNPGNAVTANILIVPSPWPIMTPTAGNPLNPPLFAHGMPKDAWTLNPWRYTAGRYATNNVGGFDLWAVYVEGKKIKRISNWDTKVQVTEVP